MPPVKVTDPSNLERDPAAWSQAEGVSADH